MSLDPALVLSIISTVLSAAAHARFHLRSRCCGQIVSLDLTPKVETPLIKNSLPTAVVGAPADSYDKTLFCPKPSSLADSRASDGAAADKR